nr:immunoglobulin light chain junction region [Macaca mulatta]MOV37483.1 immunoglobulin light chain junction region [Macaca mulatta]MOV37627.1 immunoglobulin light chain junction region [Macaca mulatta]MOV37632.1 immunoglobulin light chain junction region [Macaca mulatta]
CQKYSFSPFTF